MSERTFLIQRYCSGNWPQVKGDLPFLATGPRFFNWAIKGSLELRGCHVFVGTLREDIRSVLKENSSDARLCVAELLLREEIVQALWTEHSRRSREDRFAVSIESLAREIPSDSPIDEATVEYLSGLADPAYFRSYVSEDEIVLEPLDCGVRRL